MKYSYLKNMNWSMLRTAALQRLLAIVLLFSAVGAVVAQNPGDTLPVGLRVVSFEVNEDNYTGFDDGSERKLRNALKDLNDKLSPAAQSAFKAYDLGMYRVSGGGNQKIKDDIAAYIDQAKLASTYYIICVKIWKTPQELNEFKLYFNLPEPQIPAFIAYDQGYIINQGLNYISNAYIEKGRNPQRVKEAQALGIRNFTEFLFKLPEPEIFDCIECSTSTGGGGIARPGSTGEAYKGSQFETYVTVSNEMIVLDVSQPAFTVYFNYCPDSKFQGTIKNFRIGDKFYHAWGYPSTRKFVGFAEGVMNEELDRLVPVKSTYYTRTTEPEPINSAINVVINKIVYNNTNIGEEYVFNYVVSIQSATLFNGGSTNLSDVASWIAWPPSTETLISSGPAYNSCSNRPSNTTVVPRSNWTDITNSMGTPGAPETAYPIDDEFDFNAVLPVKIYDYTGKFSNLKGTFSGTSLHQFESVDFIITDDLTGSDIKNYIRYNLKPIHRNFLWIQIRYEQPLQGAEEMMFDYELITASYLNEELSTQLKSQASYLILQLKYGLGGVFKNVGAFCGTASRVIRKAKIPRRYYDCTKEDYVYADWGDQPCMGNPITNLISNNFKHSTAMTAGMWNGIVDIGASGFDLVQIGSFMGRWTFDQTYKNEIIADVEEFGEFFQNNRDTVLNPIARAIGKEWNTVMAEGSTLRYYYCTYAFTLFGPKGIKGVLNTARSTITLAKSGMRAMKLLLVTGVNSGKAAVNTLMKYGYIIEADVTGVFRVVRNLEDTPNPIFLKIEENSGKVLFYSDEGHFFPENVQIINSSKLLGSNNAELTLYELKKADGEILLFITASSEYLIQKLMTTFQITNELASSLIRKTTNVGKLLNADFVANINALDGTKKLAFFTDLTTTGLGASLGDMIAIEVKVWEMLKNLNMPPSLTTDLFSLKLVSRHIADEGKTIQIVKNELIAAGTFDIWLVDHFVTYERHGFILSKASIDDAFDTHINVVESVAKAEGNQMGGISGGHNLDAYKTTLYDPATNMYHPVTNKKAFVVEWDSNPLKNNSTNPASNVNGWFVKEYITIKRGQTSQLVKVDPSSPINTIKDPTGADVFVYNGPPHICKKTVYDPTIVTPLEVKQLGYRVFLEGLKDPTNNLKGRKVFTEIDGLPVEGFFDATNKVPYTWYFK
jgi:hypothetical protein